MLLYTPSSAELVNVIMIIIIMQKTVLPSTAYYLRVWQKLRNAKIT